MIKRLEALKDAVKRYREFSVEPADEEKVAKGIRLFQCAAAASDIGQALLSQEPITRTALEKLGYSAIGWGWRHFEFGRLIVRQQDDGSWLAYIGTIENPVNPQPKHVGALLSLLLWLEDV